MVCPKCRGDLIESKLNFRCDSCEIFFTRNPKINFLPSTAPTDDDALDAEEEAAEALDDAADALALADEDADDAVAASTSNAQLALLAFELIG